MRSAFRVMQSVLRVVRDAFRAMQSVPHVVRDAFRAMQSVLRVIRDAFRVMQSAPAWCEMVSANPLTISSLSRATMFRSRPNRWTGYAVNKAETMAISLPKTVLCSNELEICYSCLLVYFS